MDGNATRGTHLSEGSHKLEASIALAKRDAYSFSVVKRTIFVTVHETIFSPGMATAVFRDPTGDIRASILADLLEEHPSDIVEKQTVKLRAVFIILYPEWIPYGYNILLEDGLHLTIGAKNIGRVFKASPIC